MKSDTVWIDESPGQTARKQHGILARPPQPYLALASECLSDVTGDVCADHDESVQPAAMEVRPDREKQKKHQRPAATSRLQQEDGQRGTDNREHVRPGEPVAQAKCKTDERGNERPP